MGEETKLLPSREHNGAVSAGIKFQLKMSAGRLSPCQAKPGWLLPPVLSLHGRLATVGCSFTLLVQFELYYHRCFHQMKHIKLA